MKIAIIGAGHIGSAIVTCLAQGHLYNEKDIIVSNPNIDKLERLQEHFPAIHKYAEMVMDENMSVIHIIGSLHWERTQVESHIMDTIKDIPVSLISYGGSDHCFTLSVHTTDKNRLISSLSRQFFESQCAA